MSGSKAWILLAALGLASACRDDDQSESGSASASMEPEAAPAPAPSAVRARSARFDFIEHLRWCEVRHGGLLLDLGDTAVDARRDYALGPFDDLKRVEHGGVRGMELFTRRLDLKWWAPEGEPGLTVAIEGRGVRSKRLAVYIDGKRLGAARLSEENERVMRFQLTDADLGKGEHEVSVRVSGLPKADPEPYAVLNWVRLGPLAERDPNYSAPTLQSIVTDVALSKAPRRAIALNAHSSVRCPLWVADGARLRLNLGYWGAGEGDVEVRLLAEEGDPITLQERHVAGGDTASWTPVSIDLGDYDDQLRVLEFHVHEATRGGRVALGEPSLVDARPPALGAPETDLAIVVVLGALSPGHLPPERAGFAALAELRRSGVLFSNYRVPSTVPAAVMASLISGRWPAEHTLEDQAARLPREVPVLSRWLKEVSGAAAMFTGVPTTMPAFGFEEGWDRYESSSPVADIAAGAPFRQAAGWLEQEFAESGERKRVVVVHARGAHPPWDIPQKEAAKLKPKEYSGPLEPRRGAIELAKVRERRLERQRRLPEEDWIRLRELEFAALLEQDRALQRLIAVLKQHRAWERALVIVTSDVGAGAPPGPPYDPAPELSEARLTVPLLVKFPGNRFAGTETTTAATTVDLTRTILRALNLHQPVARDAIDLVDLAVGRDPLVRRAIVARRGPRYATRLGPWLLSGQFGKTPHLCRTDVDPACVVDLYDEQPHTARALWMQTYFSAVDARAARDVEREPASIDPDTAAALTVWGDLR